MDIIIKKETKNWFHYKIIWHHWHNGINGDPSRARTYDTMVKSHLLYLLSYGTKMAGIPGLEPGNPGTKIQRLTNLAISQWWKGRDSNPRTSRSRVTAGCVWPLRYPSWCWWQESNLQPTDYKSVALPNWATSAWWS